jgi:hypothetical protein
LLRRSHSSHTCRHSASSWCWLCASNTSVRSPSSCLLEIDVGWHNHFIHYSELLSQHVLEGDFKLRFDCDAVIDLSCYLLHRSRENATMLRNTRAILRWYNLLAHREYSTRQAPQKLGGLRHVQNVIAVASGKGGVGKSTAAGASQVTLVLMHACTNVHHLL